MQRRIPKLLVQPHPESALTEPTPSGVAAPLLPLGGRTRKSPLSSLDTAEVAKPAMLSSSLSVGALATGREAGTASSNA
jgi:hypothetical protein